MKVSIEKSWEEALDLYFQTEKFKKLSTFIEDEYLKKTVYPKPQNIFKAFEHTSFDNIKVIILGQDPYHGPNQAHGLSFSVQQGVKIPPSLKNIYKEIESDIGTKKNFESGDLTAWADQGVLLLNSVLTVEKGKPGSHAKKGWEEFTDTVIKTISQKKIHCVFLLWGNYARSKKNLIDETKHLILESTHPSPFSAYNGFFGNKHFSKTNEYLNRYNKKTIIW